MRKAALIAAVLLLWAAMPVLGQEDEPQLTLGDDAPALDVAEWIKGEPLTGFEARRVYLIEFWATRNRGSRGALSALSELQDRFRDRGLAVVGITHQDPEEVREFLASPDEQGATWGERVNYALAADPDASVHRDYLAAADAGIPSVFIIGRDGKIEWIGLLQYMEPVVEAVMDGRWDRKVFPSVLDLRRDLNRTLRRGRIHDGLEILDQLIAMDLARLRDKWDDANALNEIAWFVVDERGIATRDCAFAMEAAQRANDLTQSRSPYILDTVARVYWEQGDVVNAIRWQYKAVQQSVGTGWEPSLRATLERYEHLAPTH
jgi:peroxiredoxin